MPADPASVIAAQGGDTRQLAALEPFEKGAARGRNVVQLVDHPGMSQSGNGVAAAGDAEQFAGFAQPGDLARNRDSAGVERRGFEGAEWAVPHQSATGGKLPVDRGDSRRSDIENHGVARDAINGDGFARRMRLE